MTVRALGRLCLLATLGVASSARGSGFPDATYKTLPCRPTIACTADLVPPGSVELETGALRRRTPEGVVHTVPLLFKLTLLEDLQLQLGTNTAYSRLDGRSGRFEDGYGGVKLRVARQTPWRPALGVSLLGDAVTLPARGSSAYGGLLTLFATKDFAWLHVDLNLGVNRWWSMGAHATQPFVALALSTELGAGFGVMAEGYAFGDAAFVQPKDAGLLSALTWAPVPYWMFDAGSDVAMFPSTRAYGLFVGTTVILFDLWDEVRGERREAAAHQAASRLGAR